MSSETCSSSFHLFVILSLKKATSPRQKKSPELSFLRLRRQDPIFCFPKNGQFADEPMAGPYLGVGILVCTRVPAFSMTAVRSR